MEGRIKMLTSDKKSFRSIFMKIMRQGDVAYRDYFRTYILSCQWGILVLIAFGILGISLIFTYRNKVRVGQ